MMRTHKTPSGVFKVEIMKVDSLDTDTETESTMSTTSTETLKSKPADAPVAKDSDSESDPSYESDDGTLTDGSDASSVIDVKPKEDPSPPRRWWRRGVTQIEMEPVRNNSTTIPIDESASSLCSPKSPECMALRKVYAKILIVVFGSITIMALATIRSFQTSDMGDDVLIQNVTDLIKESIKNGV
ncbi:Orf63 [Heliothis zea nudivirus]|uniref:Orf63 n=1 Tax=Heliothis zea nudivirus 1 TaxID=3116536 RepID=Q8JKP8_9VIRU|nr:Orf63 [Heliothis zea nudivirus]AAN04357.1 Orf63 [Heliothis zea nudivirus]WCZ68553.1 hypothetical protein HvNV074 [Heliothis virescens nudivirus]